MCALLGSLFCPMAFTEDTFGVVLGFIVPDDRRALRAACSVAHTAPAADQSALAVRLSEEAVSLLTAIAKGHQRWWGADRGTVVVTGVDRPSSGALCASLFRAVRELCPDATTLYLHPIGELHQTVAAALLGLVAQELPSVLTVRCGVACGGVARDPWLDEIDPHRLVDPAILRPWWTIKVDPADPWDAGLLDLLHDAVVHCPRSRDDWPVLTGARRLVVSNGSSAPPVPSVDWLARCAPAVRLLVLQNACCVCASAAYSGRPLICVILTPTRCDVHRAPKKLAGSIWVAACASGGGRWVPKPVFETKRPDSCLWTRR